jgi:hypothetical protein
MPPRRTDKTKYRRTPRSPKGLLTYRQIREWAREHLQRTGRWPTKRGGPVHGVTGQTSAGMQAMLAYGVCRGEGASLPSWGRIRSSPQR